MGVSEVRFVLIDVLFQDWHLNNFVVLLLFLSTTPVMSHNYLFNYWFLLGATVYRIIIVTVIMIVLGVDRYSAANAFSHWWLCFSVWLFLSIICVFLSIAVLFYFSFHVNFYSITFIQQLTCIVTYWYTVYMQYWLVFWLLIEHF